MNLAVLPLLPLKYEAEAFLGSNLFKVLTFSCGLQENAMKLLSEGMSLNTPGHMKDALSRIVVEMIKREWPQQWPGLMSELSHVSARGESQTELVLLVFLRLVEDVHTLQVCFSSEDCS